MEDHFYAEYNAIEDRHWWFVGRREVLLAELTRRLESRSGLRLLDFGCGTGTMALHLARFGEVHALDRDPQAVSYCRARGVPRVEQLDDHRIPFGDASFDVVTTFDVLEHIDDDLFAMSELRRVLKPGGTLLCAVPAFPFLWGAQDEISHHFRRYVRPQLSTRLEDAGLEVLRASYFNSLLFPPIAAIRLLRRALPARRDEELTSDFGTGPAALNGLLGRLFAAEARLLARRDLPFGVSLFALCTPRPR